MANTILANTTIGYTLYNPERITKSISIREEYSTIKLSNYVYFKNLVKKSINDIYCLTSDNSKHSLFDIYCDLVNYIHYLIITIIDDTNKTVEFKPIFTDLSSFEQKNRIKFLHHSVFKSKSNLFLNNYQPTLIIENATPDDVEYIIKHLNPISDLNDQLTILIEDINFSQSSVQKLNLDNHLKDIIKYLKLFKSPRPFIHDKFYDHWKYRIFNLEHFYSLKFKNKKVVSKIVKRYKNLVEHEKTLIKEYNINCDNAINFTNSSVEIPSNYRCIYGKLSNSLNVVKSETIRDLFSKYNPEFDKYFVNIYCLLALSKVLTHHIMYSEVIQVIFREILFRKKEYKNIIYTCLWYSLYYLTKEEASGNITRCKLLLQDVEKFRLDKVDIQRYDNNPFGVLGVNVIKHDYINYSVDNCLFNNRKHLGIYNTSKFIRRLSVFTHNLLKGLRWKGKLKKQLTPRDYLTSKKTKDKTSFTHNSVNSRKSVIINYHLYVTGSCLPACLIKNPLEELEESEAKYFNSYYETSDIDIMVWCYEKDSSIKKPDNKCFDSVVKLLVKKIIKNYLKYWSCYILKAIKNNTFKQINILNCPFYSHISNKTISKINGYMFSGIFNQEEYQIIDNIINQFHEIFFKRNVNVFPKLTIELYQIYFQIYKKYLLINESKKILKYFEYFEYYLGQDSSYFNITKIKMKNSHKYKININGLRTFEIFRIYNKDPYQIIKKFHLPCTRAFFDGKNVNLLPSFLSASMTRMNIDYRYFASYHTPTDIILKYYLRGIGTFMTVYENKLFKMSTQLNLGDKDYDFRKLWRHSPSKYIKPYIIPDKMVDSYCYIPSSIKRFTTRLEHYKYNNMTIMNNIIKNKKKFTSSIFFDESGKLWNFDRFNLSYYFDPIQ